MNEVTPAPGQLAGVLSDMPVLPDGLDMPPEMMAGLMDALDLPVIDDTADPFATLDPQFKRLAKHLMDQFDARTLPRMLRPFAPALPGLLAGQLAEKPAEAQETARELINMVVRDLGIPLIDVRDAWDAEGLPLPPDDE